MDIHEPWSMTLRVSFFIFFEILISALIKVVSAMRIVQQTILSSILGKNSNQRIPHNLWFIYGLWVINHRSYERNKKRKNCDKNKNECILLKTVISKTGLTKPPHPMEDPLWTILLKAIWWWSDDVEEY